MSKNDDTAQRCAGKMYANDRAVRALGIEVDVMVAGAAQATMTVREDMVNGHDIVHGGLVFTLADTAFAYACNGYGEQAVAASAQIEFLRPGLLHDLLTATASEDYRGRRKGYYSVRVCNQRDELIALFRGRSASTGKSLLDQSDCRQRS